MTAPIHLPILRAGEPYRSLTVETLTDIRSGEPVAEVSRANSGLVTRDMARVGEHRRCLDALSVAELIAISKRAAELYVSAELPLGEATQTPDDYVRQLSATTGMPESLARANMAKTHYVLAEMETVLGGLTRGLDLSLIDDGWGSQEGRPLSYRRETDVLGAVLPSNSPGVHSLWLPAIPLKVALALKPGRQEPWTPYRVAQAWIAAGCPKEAFGFYPTDHAGGQEILMRSGRSLLFGDASTVGVWATDPRIELHGPGWSKVIFGPDQAASWREHLELLVASVAGNGGRSCVNASGVWTPSHGDELAHGLAERLAGLEALPLDHPEAGLAAFSEPRVAHAISDYLDSQLAVEGAEDLTAALRPGGRVAEVDDCTFLLPTVVRCEPDHPLAQAEFLFPFVAVVEAPAEDIPRRMGPSLVVTALTEDPGMRRALLESPHAERLNLGPLPTSTVTWDQPHEGNLFEHLYRQRAFQARDFSPPPGASEPPPAGLGSSA